MLGRPGVASSDRALSTLRKISPAAWQHVHFLGRYLFRGARQPIDPHTLLAGVTL